MSIKPLDLTKPVMLRDGTKVSQVTLITDCEVGDTIIFVSDKRLQSRRASGRLFKHCEDSWDLINAPEPKRQLTLWVYARPGGSAFSIVSEEEPGSGDCHLIAKHTITEGDGL